MTKDQKEFIAKMRHWRYGYCKIAGRVKLSRNTVIRKRWKGTFLYLSNKVTGRWSSALVR